MAKRPRDPSELARQVFDIAVVGEPEDTISESKRHASKTEGGRIKGREG
ncbi:MAG TPA: hypothetical protein VK639_13675 [Terriglobales bacterium]|nr:hypothetical protein [Terriglobales bacterium]